MPNPFSTRRSSGVQIRPAAGVQTTFDYTLSLAVEGLVKRVNAEVSGWGVPVTVFFPIVSKNAFLDLLRTSLTTRFGAAQISDLNVTLGSASQSTPNVLGSQGLRIDFRCATARFDDPPGFLLAEEVARSFADVCERAARVHTTPAGEATTGEGMIGREPVLAVQAARNGGERLPGPRAGQWAMMAQRYSKVSGGTPPGGTPPGGTPPGGTPPGGTPTTYVAPPSSLTEAQLSTVQKTAIQQRLNELGYRGANGLALVADGNIGANTRAAISDFQRNNALSPVDGVAGRDTREKLALSTAVRATGTSPPGGTPPGGTGNDALAGYRAAASELQTWIRSQPMSAIYDSNRRSVFSATLEGYQRRMNMGAASDGKYGPGTRSRMRELGVATPYEFPATPGATPVVEPPPQPMPSVAPVTANAASVSTQGVPWWAWGIGLAIVGGAVMYAGMAGGGGGGGGGSREQYAALPRAEDRRVVVRPLRNNPRKSNKRRRR